MPLLTHVLSNDTAVEVERPGLEVLATRYRQPRNALGSCKPSAELRLRYWMLVRVRRNIWCRGGDKYMRHDPTQDEGSRQPSHRFLNGFRYFFVSARDVSTPARPRGWCITYELVLGSCASGFPTSTHSFGH